MRSPLARTRPRTLTEAPKSSVQVSFVDAENPAGRALAPGERLDLPPISGATSARLRVTEGKVSAHVGDAVIPEWNGRATLQGFQPLHGTPTLTAGPKGATLTEVELFQRAPSASETTDWFPLGRVVRAGETVDVPLSPFRRGQGIEQIESLWTAAYSVPDPSGKTSDEGKPFYLDGVYCEIFLVGADGVERKVDRRRFVDANEVDNAHDLPNLKGETLRFKFSAPNPEGANHPLTFRGVRVRYFPPSGAELTTLRFELGSTLAPGQRVEVELPPEHRDTAIGRVDVRWTDMLSGTWKDPGRAVGTLLVDGQRVGRTEAVQSPETQSFTFLDGAKAKDGKVGVLIERDSARVDWLEVFLEKSPS